MQSYIKKPLLLKGKKMEIRSYWLIASVNPLLILFFDESTVRLSSNDFKEGDWDNARTHITNTHRLKKEVDKETYELLKSSLKISTTEMQELIIMQELTENKNYWIEVLQPAIMEMIRKAIKSVEPALRKENQSTFEILGIDVILDENLNVRSVPSFTYKNFRFG